MSKRNGLAPVSVPRLRRPTDAVFHYNMGSAYFRHAQLTSVPLKSTTRLTSSILTSSSASRRRYWLLLGESHLTKRLFGSMLRRIAGRSCESREIDPEPRGDGEVSDKTGWEGRGQQSRDSGWGEGTLSRAWAQPKKE